MADAKTIVKAMQDLGGGVTTLNSKIDTTKTDLETEIKNILKTVPIQRGTLSNYTGELVYSKWVIEEGIGRINGDDVILSETGVVELIRCSGDDMHNYFTIMGTGGIKSGGNYGSIFINNSNDFIYADLQKELGWNNIQLSEIMESGAVGGEKNDFSIDMSGLPAYTVLTDADFN